jgi:uncharacterized membrane protein
MGRWRAVSPYALAALLAAAGATHLVVPRIYDGLVPTWLPGEVRTWVLASGLLELAVAGVVLVPRTRRLGGAAAAALFVGLFPGNVQMVLDPGGLPRWLAVARLPLQVPLVLWGLQVAGFLSSTGRRR